MVACLVYTVKYKPVISLGNILYTTIGASVSLGHTNEHTKDTPS